MRTLILFFFLFSSINLSAQQAWTQKKGEAYAQLGVSSLKSNKLHNLSEDAIVMPRPISELIISSYVEYGITDNFMFSLTLPFHIVSSGELNPDWNGLSPPSRGELSKLGTIHSSLTYKFRDKEGLVLSSKLGIGLNTSTNGQPSGLQTGVNATTFSPSLLAGIGKENYFTSAELGVNLLTKGYLPRLVFNAQIGKKFMKNDQFILILSFLSSTALGESTSYNDLILDGKARYTGLYVNDQSYYAGSLKLGYDICDHWTAWTSFSGGIAKNVGQGIVYSFSLSYKWFNE